MLNRKDKPHVCIQPFAFGTERKGKPEGERRMTGLIKMAGDVETEAESEGLKHSQQQQQQEEEKGDDCLFVWDETTQLYFHSRSGFYHDPSAGWYYSRRDGLYYKFQNGSYVLWDSHEDGVNENEPNCNGETAFLNPLHERIDTNLSGGQVADHNGSDMGNAEYSSNQASNIPPRPSEWLEETLFHLYLTGYNQKVDAVDTSVTQLMDAGDIELSADDEDAIVCKESEWVKEDCSTLTDPSCGIEVDDALRDEENWRAQYGQVIHSGEEPTAHFSIVGLWDWTMLMDTKKDGKGLTARLVGRLTKTAARLHPSMPSNGGLFRTAPISEVHLNLVRVRTGRVYKLHSPSARYLASLSSYDSSNPTRDWGFPQFSIESSAKTASESSDGHADYKDVNVLPDETSSSRMQKSYIYRDRAAERRNLHGSFSVGPGQKRSLVGDVDGSDLPVSTSAEEAAAEALNMSLGGGSYAQKILKSMGWKEGDPLGRATKGLVEPLKIIGNIGSAGLGWPQSRQKHH